MTIHIGGFAQLAINQQLEKNAVRGEGPGRIVVIRASVFIVPVLDTSA